MILQRYIFILLCLVGLLLTLGSTSCNNGPDIPDSPSLSFTGMDKDTIRQSIGTDESFVISLRIEDGDGDIGNEGDSLFNLFIIDSRTGQDYDQPVQIPTLPEGLSQNGVIIDAELRLFATCCIFPDGTFPCETSDEFPLDSLQLDITIQDRAGNMSNTVTSDFLYIRCDEI